MRVQMRRILCTTDFSDFSNHVVPYAVALAREFKAKLYLCHVIDLSSAAIYGEAVLAMEEQQSRMTAFAHGEIRKLVEKAPLEWEPLVTIGNPALEIARLAEEKGVDLAIAASHGRSGLKRLILGSVTERLMRTLPCPLLVVRSPEYGFVKSAEQEIQLKQIMVGHDFSSDSDLALQYGLSLAQEFQAVLHLIHVVEPPSYEDLVKPASMARDKFQQDVRRRLREKLINMVPEEARAWCTPVATLLAGEPHDELTKYALVNSIDLIILGVRGHSLVESLFVGSTTDRVIRAAPCPVLSVRPKAKVG
jgi:nucleotide-binding universal stress UspA family protein